MLVNLEKDGMTMAVKDDIQLAAFLNNGWVKVEAVKPVIEENIVKPKNDLVEKVETEIAKFNYSKTEVNRMSTSDLQKLAKQYDIDDTLAGSKLKKILIEKFDL